MDRFGGAIRRRLDSKVPQWERKERLDPEGAFEFASLEVRGRAGPAREPRPIPGGDGLRREHDDVVRAAEKRSADSDPEARRQ